MLAKLIEKCLYFPPDGVKDEKLIADGYKEYEQSNPPENLPKTQQAVYSLTDTGDKIVLSYKLVPVTPGLDEALKEVQILQAKSAVIELTKGDDKTFGIQCMALYPYYIQNKQHDAGEVARHPETGYPWECMTAYDGTVQQDWTIDNRTLWKPWHSRKPEYALPYEAPTGAHDMYKAGEYMIWTDGNLYKCIQDTNFSPKEYPDAWEISFDLQIAGL